MKGKGPKGFGHRGKPGFALVYALLVSVCFVTFFAALTYQMRDTVSTLRQSEDLMKARALATMGNEFVYQLLREDMVDWRATPYSFSNEPGPDYFRGLPEDSPLRETLSAEALGGYFTVKLENGREVDDLVLPDGGTYLVSTCNARVNRRETVRNESSRFVVKMSNPFVNYLSAVSGVVGLRTDCLINGPIYARERADGSGGDIELLAHRLRRLPDGTMTQIRETVEVGGVYSARGKVEIVNHIDGSQIVVRELLRGEMAVGQQVLVPPSFGPLEGAGLGGIEVVADFIFESGVSTLVDISTRDEVFADLRDFTDSSSGGLHNINLDALGTRVSGRGVLLEFEGRRAVMSEIVLPFYGRQYDLAVMESSLRSEDSMWSTYVDRIQGVAGMERGLRECSWNDPAFADGPAPSNLRDALVSLGADPAKIPPLCDYYDIFKIERGTVLQTFDIADNDFTHLRFVSSQASCPSEGKGPGIPGDQSFAPPVYVRGQIDGKVVISYEAKGDLTDESTWPGPDYAPNRVIILADDAGPDYPPVSGGLTLADDRTMTSFDAEGDFSNDYCLIVTNGDVQGIGLPLFTYRWLCGSPGGGKFRANYDSWKDVLDIENHRDVLATEVPPDHEYRAFITSSRSQLPGKFHGVTISNGGKFMKEGFGPTGQPLPTEHDFGLPIRDVTNPPPNWTEIAETYSVADPVLSTLNDCALIPHLMRLGCSSQSSVLLTEGAHAFFERDAPVIYPRGRHNYDYRWRTMDADTMEKDLQIKVTPILLERRGY